MLLLRLQATDSRPAALLHYGQGKWYPGEPLPRWALSCLWRTDGMPLWRDAKLLAEDGKDYGHGDSRRAGVRAGAGRRGSGLHRDYVIPAYEDVWDVLRKEQRRPGQLRSARAQPRATRPSARGWRTCSTASSTMPAGFVLPLEPAGAEPATGRRRWRSSRWPLRREHLYLIPGDSPLGLRLPLDSLPVVAPADAGPAACRPIRSRRARRSTRPCSRATDAPSRRRRPRRRSRSGESAREIDPHRAVRRRATGSVHVFLPPVPTVEDFVALIDAVEETARETLDCRWCSRAICRRRTRA